MKNKITKDDMYFFIILSFLILVGYGVIKSIM